MKTFREFCVDANIQEFWNPFAPKAKPKPAAAKPNTKVLAYRNYQPGVLDKATGKFTQRPLTKAETNRYPFKPVEMTYYEPTGNLTASGKRLTNTSPPSAAVPYVSPTNTRPSIPFGTRFQATRAPMGKNTKSTEFEVTDTGRMGHNAPGFVNPNTKFDASPTLRAALKLNGKQMVYVKKIN